MSTVSPILKKANHRDNANLRRQRRIAGRARKMTIASRISIGFEAREWHWICDLAQETDCTVSEIVREIVRGAYDQQID